MRTLNGTSLLDQATNDLWQDTSLHDLSGRSRFRPFALSVLVTRDSGPTDVVLLDERRVQAVEIQKKDKVVVEANFRVEHETTSVFGLLAFLGKIFALYFVGEDIFRRLGNISHAFFFFRRLTML